MFKFYKYLITMFNTMCVCKILTLKLFIIYNMIISLYKNQLINCKKLFFLQDICTFSVV